MNQNRTPLQGDELARPTSRVESASATTDHEHNWAGAFPVVLTVVVLAVLCLFGALVGGCTSSLVRSAVLYDSWDRYDDYDYFDYYDDEGLDGLGLDDGFDLDTGTDDWWEGLSGSSAPRDLEEGLALYVDDFDITVNSMVGASSYSGVPAEVRDYVQKLCSIDAKANEDVMSGLRPALATVEGGGAPAGAKEAIASARDRARKAAEEVAALAAPTADKKVSRLLADAASEVEDRWNDAADALDALGLAADEDDGESLAEFDDCLDGARSSLFDAGLDLMDALDAAAGR